MPSVHDIQLSQLSISGDVPHPCHLAIDGLREMPSERLGATELVCLTGAHLGRAASYRGVRLTALLDVAGFPLMKTSRLKQMIVMAYSIDGYRVLFTWHELYNTPIGKHVLVLYERDGQPLSGAEGTFALISVMDNHNGPRHVKCLARIEARLL